MESETASITSVDDLIRAFGGPLPLAEAVEESVGTIRQWKHRNRLPAQKYLRQHALFSSRGLRVSPDLWGQEAPA